MQFRAVSYGLFGKEDYHKAVRRKAVKYMNEHKQDFEAFLGESFHSYMKEMAQSSSWGDELTLARPTCILHQSLAVQSTCLLSCAFCIKRQLFLLHGFSAFGPASPLSFASCVAPQLCILSHSAAYKLHHHSTCHPAQSSTVNLAFLLCCTSCITLQLLILHGGMSVHAAALLSCACCIVA